MKKDFQAFRSRKTTLVVVAPHGPEKVAAYWQKEELPMIGIPDRDGKLAALYGQAWKLLKLGRMPALFVIDQNGTLVMARYSKSMSDIPQNSDVLKALDGLPDGYPDLSSNSRITGLR